MYKKLTVFTLVIILLVTSLFTACRSSTSSSTSTTTESTTQSTIATITSAQSTTQSVTSTQVPTSTVAASPANWWDELGEPKYGGKLTWRLSTLPYRFDPYNYSGLITYPFESLFMQNWTTAPDTWDFKTTWTPEEYWSGLLVDTWEWVDPQRVILNIRHGVYWQNKPPVNGREFTAYDVEYHFDRLLGTGQGYTVPSPYLKAWIGLYEKATATDKYTVELKFKKGGIVNRWIIFEPGTQNIEAPESVKQDLLKNWQDVVGTGPWMLTDFVSDSSISLTKNPDYWGFDERYPENRLPYFDSISVVRILDNATAIAALRTGKIDEIDEVDWQQAGTISDTNQDLQTTKIPSRGTDLVLNCDVAAFKDIRVRTAMQMALDLPTIAASHYGGTIDGIAAGIMSPAYKGYAYTYENWPQSLKDEYSYNPDKAKALLKEAGYPDGFDTNVIAFSQMDRSLIQIIQAYVADISIDMEIQILEQAQGIALVRSGKHEIFMGTGIAGLSPQIALDNNVSKVSFAHHGDLNYDALVEKFNNATTIEEAKTFCIEADKLMLQQHYSVTVLPIVTFSFWQSYLKGFNGAGATVKVGLGSYWARYWFDKE